MKKSRHNVVAELQDRVLVLEHAIFPAGGEEDLRRVICDGGEPLPVNGCSEEGEVRNEMLDIPMPSVIHAEVPDEGPARLIVDSIAAYGKALAMGHAELNTLHDIDQAWKGAIATVTAVCDNFARCTLDDRLTIEALDANTATLKATILRHDESINNLGEALIKADARSAPQLLEQNVRLSESNEKLRKDVEQRQCNFNELSDELVKVSREQMRFLGVEERLCNAQERIERLVEGETRRDLTIVELRDALTKIEGLPGRQDTRIRELVDDLSRKKRAAESLADTVKSQGQMLAEFRKELDSRPASPGLVIVDLGRKVAELEKRNKQLKELNIATAYSGAGVSRDLFTNLQEENAQHETLILGMSQELVDARKVTERLNSGNGHLRKSLEKATRKATELRERLRSIHAGSSV